MDKAETHNLLGSFSNAKYDNFVSVRNHILKLTQIVSRLRGVNMPVSNDFMSYSV